jgi:hypothetical protein
MHANLQLISLSRIFFDYLCILKKHIMLERGLTDLQMSLDCYQKL